MSASATASTNRLAKESSPYLLQHAHNPVDWFPWGEEALQKAVKEDKPILVSVGYAACHWCHVMEKESFEDVDTARFMNEFFVNIKIDREERPDLDHIYMDAVQAITGSGGWPLNVFLTPTGKPFYGGTYFPPRPAYNRSSWKEVLSGVLDSFRERRETVEQQAAQLTEHVATAGSFGIGDPASMSTAAPLSASASPVTGSHPLFNTGTLRQIRDQLLATADKDNGGFGGAPKFPQTFSLRYLLHYHYYTGDPEALEQVCLSLDKMILGGIYDQIGGGFARYSTDGEWLVPHFEKMLYDNALLVILLSEVYQLTGKELYRLTIRESIAFIKRELSNGKGGFYSALDADSEGIEGKYYVWNKEEIEKVLGEDALLFCDYYGVSSEGNWEGSVILTRPGSASRPAGGTGSEPELSAGQRQRLESARLRLLEHRSRRIPPALDDKILLGWNALMNMACSKAYAALGEEEYRQMAIDNMEFLQQHLKGEGIYFYYHSYKGEARYPAFLDDYASLITALLQLQEITGDTGYLDEARRILEEVIPFFGEETTGFFFYTHAGQNDLILRKREIYDGATPSGNSMMAFNLLYMSIIFNEPAWADRAFSMATALRDPVTRYPGSFGGWATLYQAFTYTIPEIVITGKSPESTRKEFLQHLIPYRVFQSAEEENARFPLLRDKEITAGSLLFLCKNYSCQLPVNEVPTLIRNLENVHKFQ